MFPEIAPILRTVKEDDDDNDDQVERRMWRLREGTTTLTVFAGWLENRILKVHESRWSSYEGIRHDWMKKVGGGWGPTEFSVTACMIGT